MSKQPILDAVLREHLTYFIIKVFNTLNPAEPYIANWHIDAIAYQLERMIEGDLRRLLITMPPRSLKSICVSVALPAFFLGHDPSQKIVCISYAKELAAKFSRDFKTIVTSDWYKRLFPDFILTKETENLFETDKGGSRLATSFGGTVTGLGGAFVIIDDPMSADDAQSETTRKSVIKSFGGTSITRLNDKTKGRIIVVMQRLHEDDLAGHILSRKPCVWDHLNLPAKATKNETIALGNGKFHNRKVGELLSPVREPQWVLDELQAEMGMESFSAQYQQDPVPAEGIRFKREWVVEYSELPELSEGIITQSWDTAMKGHAGADFSVCTTWLEHSKKHYLIDIFREQLEFPDLLDQALAQYQLHRPGEVLIEDRSSGTPLAQHLRANTSIRVRECKPDRDKQVRFDRILPMFRAKEVYLPRNAPWLATLMNELLAFPSSRHDDQVDSISQYLGEIFDRDRSSQFSIDWGCDDRTTHDDIAASLAERARLRPPRSD